MNEQPVQLTRGVRDTSQGPTVRRSRRTRLFVALSIAAILFPWPGPASAQRVKTINESQAKAMCLINFGRFVRWPAPGEFLVIGIVGQDSLGAYLDEAAEKLWINGRQVVVRRFGPRDDFTSADILFVSKFEESRAQEILTRTRGRAILTVGETRAFMAEGGLVRVFLEQHRLRFEIDAPNAERVGLKLHSGLLALAVK